MAVAVASYRLIPLSGSMTSLLIAVLASLRATTRSRLELAAEILALRLVGGRAYLAVNVKRNGIV